MGVYGCRSSRNLFLKRDVNLNVICMKRVLNPMLPKYGAKQIERGGPGTEPCGIPHERGAKEDRVAKADTESSI